MIERLVAAIKKLKEIVDRHDNDLRVLAAQIKNNKGKDGKDGKDGKYAAKGEKGSPGKDGKDGKQGPSGKDGKDGLSAYAIAAKKGFKGTEDEWVKSLQGKDRPFIMGGAGRLAASGGVGTQGPAGSGAVKGTLAGTEGSYTLTIAGYTLADGDFLMVKAHEDITNQSLTTISVNGSDPIAVIDSLELPLFTSAGVWVPLIYIEAAPVFIVAMTALPATAYEPTDPTVDNDITERYSLGSHWYNSTSGDVFICFSNSEGSAEWVKTTA